MNINYKVLENDNNFIIVKDNTSKARYTILDLLILLRLCIILNNKNTYY